MVDMRVKNIGGYRRINAFVKAKLDKFNSMEHSFSALYSLMFSEKDNIFFEKSVGYRIEKTTYGKCFDDIERKAETLNSILVDAQKNDVIGLFMENGAEWIENFWTVLRAGYRPLLMNMRLSPSVLETALENAGAKAVISDSAVFSLSIHS